MTMPTLFHLQRKLVFLALAFNTRVMTAPPSIAAIDHRRVIIVSQAFFTHTFVCKFTICQVDLSID